MTGDPPEKVMAMGVPPPSFEDLGRALAAVGSLIDGIRPEQWSAATPCTEWTVGDLVTHVVGANLIFAAILNDKTPPERDADVLGENPARAFRESGAALQAAFEQPGVLQRVYSSALGTASGEDRLHIRIYDLLAHGWDLAQATGQPVELPEDLAERALAFVQIQFSTMPRTGRFDPPRPVPGDAPAIERLVGFLGRSGVTQPRDGSAPA
jgi:uncharacterized protein (TIGR03086 family)